MPTSLEQLTDADWALFLGRARRETFGRGDAILRQGDGRLALYVLKRGFARVERTDHGADIAVGSLGPGELFGEMSFLEGVAASASVVAADDVDVDVIDGATVQSLLMSDPGLSSRFYRSLALTLSSRLRRASTELAQLRSSDVPNGGHSRDTRTGHVQARQIPADLVRAVQDFREHVQDAVAGLARHAIDDATAQTAVSGACEAVLGALEHQTGLDALVAAGMDDPLSFTDPSALEAGFGAYVFREGFPIFMSSATLARCYTKPRGYPNDWETLRRIHRNEPEGEGRLGALVDRWFLDRPICRTIRASRDWMASLLVEAADGAADHPIEVTSVASKAGSELLDAMAARPGAIRATCLDGDPAALREGGQLARRLSLEDAVSFVNANVVRVAAGETRVALPPQQVISALGLLEYLNDADVVALLNWARATLAPGGAFIGTNLRISGSDRVLTNHILEWPIVSRSEGELRDLIAESAFGHSADAEPEIALDQESGTVFARVVRS
ncbi:MAG TPA: cyclic nucleotide-binding domain-containing protein [Gemmatimonadaceae bacterium]